MGLSFDQYVGNGTTGPYNVNFSFLSRSDVLVKVDTVSVAFTWLSDTQVQLDAVAAVDAAIEIRRTTPRASLQTDFNDASTLTEADLDNNSLQLFYLAQEAIDDASNITLDSDGALSAGTKKLKDLVDGTASNHAVTKSQLDAVVAAAGNVTTPNDPADDFKVVMAENGTWSWAVALGAFFRNTFAAVADVTAARTALGLGSIATQASSSVTITGGTISGGTITPAVDVQGVPPIGTVVDYAGSTLPAGNNWDWCDGDSMDSVGDTTLAALFTAIGTTYGGAGAADFNLPDLRGRVSVGQDDMGGSAASRVTTGGSGIDGATLGATGGSQDTTLTTTELPAHDHKLFTTTAAGSTASEVGATGSAASDNLPDADANHRYQMKAASGNATLAESSTEGTGSAFGTMPPAQVLNKIIKVRD